MCTLYLCVHYLYVYTISMCILSLCVHYLYVLYVYTISMCTLSLCVHYLYVYTISMCTRSLCVHDLYVYTISMCILHIKICMCISILLSLLFQPANDMDAELVLLSGSEGLALAELDLLLQKS